jgi:uncharacterized protein (TIGR02996 family)
MSQRTLTTSLGAATLSGFRRLGICPPPVTGTGEPLVDGMPALPPLLNLDWDDLGDRTFVLLPDRLTDEPVLEAVTDQVMWLVNVLGRRRFVLDFVRVPYLTSGPIRRSSPSASGSTRWRARCGWRVNAPCREVLEITKVLPLFQVLEECPVSTPPTSEQDAAFRPAIVEAPDDLAPRLMYADWLQERAEPLGEFIRLQCMLEDMPENDSRRPELNPQAQRLLARYRWQWLGPLAPHIASSCEFRRGFAEEVVLDAARLLNLADVLFATQPVRYLKILDGGRLIDELVQCKYLARLLDLQFHNNYMGDTGIATLVRSPHLTELRGLHLMQPDHRPRRQTIAGALNSPTATLDLAGNRIGDVGVAALANSPHLARLTTLKLNQNHIDRRAARGEVLLPPSPHHARPEQHVARPGLPYPEERNIIPR